MASRVINKGIEQVAIDLLKHHPRNANHGDVEAIKKSLAVNGWYGSVVANQSTKHILAGNHRVMAAKALGWETVPVQWVDVTPEEELRILVVDNRTTRIGQDDTTKITDILAELSNTHIGLDGTGYSADDLDALIDSLTETGEPEELLTDPDEVPEEVETRCKPGDLWILGNHRLLCGDSTKVDDVERLMGGATVDAVVTDPPYGMNLNTDYSLIKGTEKSKNALGYKYDSVIGDNAPFDRNAIKVEAKEEFWFGADYYRETLPPGGSWSVWIKRGPDDKDMIGNDIELLWSKVAHKRRAFWLRWVGWDAREKDEKRAHPTQKPIKLLAEVISSVSCETVVDPFLGSGTTLIAAEQLGRKCYGMEISPKYCDVIIQRWENATGKKAVRDEG